MNGSAGDLRGKIALTISNIPNVSGLSVEDSRRALSSLLCDGLLRLAIPVLGGGRGANYRQLLEIIGKVGERNHSAGFVLGQAVACVYYFSRFEDQASAFVSNFALTPGHRVLVASSEKGVHPDSPRAVLSKTGEGLYLNGHDLDDKKGRSRNTRGKNYVSGLDPAQAEQTLLLVSCSMGERNCIAPVIAHSDGVRVLLCDQLSFLGSDTNSVTFHDVRLKSNFFEVGNRGVTTRHSRRYGSILMLSILANQIGYLESVLRPIECDKHLDELIDLRVRILDLAGQIDNDLTGSIDSPLRVEHQFAEMIQLKVRLQVAVEAFSVKEKDVRRVSPEIVHEMCAVGKLSPLNHNDALSYLRGMSDRKWSNSL